MRLLSQKSREYKGKAYHKFWIVVPSKLLHKLGWKAGDQLEAEAKNNKLVITKEDKTRVELVKAK
ncbi:AbrB/MazE/SpoVT family DNA-binding domain-containing protein [Candidatus Woesearchaeota archaeon]|nr:AbrB/MazE/SpoVT family DNA-binding domain-containing protein [Candidatus Woesearchaeota archaeon]